MSTVEPWVFRDPDGHPFRGVGLNLCWESRDHDDSAWFGRLHEDERFGYEEMIPRLAALGVNLVRVWMVYWNLPVDWPTPANNRRYRPTPAGQSFNPDGTAALRRLIRLCEVHKVKLMLCLETHVGFLGEGWALNPYNRANGGPATTPREFFTSPEARAQYRRKLDHLVENIGASSAVACWEFFNEIDNLTFDPTYGGPVDDPAVVDWHREMAAYLKGLDPLHRPVTTSISHREIPGLWELGLDLNQHHIYCRTDEIPGDLEACLARTGTPHVIGEFGKHWDWSLDFRTLEPGFSDDLVRGLWLGLFSPTPILPLTWWWEYFEDRGEWEVFREVRRVSDAMLAAGGGSFELLSATKGPEGMERQVRTGSVIWTLRLPVEGREVSVSSLPGETADGCLEHLSEVLLQESNQCPLPVELLEPPTDLGEEVLPRRGLRESQVDVTVRNRR